MALKLSIEDATGRRIEPLGRGPVVVGRSEEADILLTEPRASREHLEIRTSGSAATVRDLGSTNGTFRGEERLLQATIRPGDRLRIGETSLTLVEEQAPGRGDRSSASRTLLALFAPALILLLLAQVGLYAVTSSRGDEVDRAMRRVERAELALATRAIAKEPGVALARLEAFLEKYPQSSYRSDAKIALAEVRPKVGRIVRAGRDLDEVERLVGELAFSELHYRYEKLLEKYSDLPGVSKHIRDALADLARTHRESLVAMVGRVQSEVESLLDRGQYGRALSLVTSFTERSPSAASAFVDEIRAAESEIMDRAEGAYREVLARAERLAEEAKTEEGIALLREEAPRFTGTRFNAFLRLRAESLGRRSRREEVTEKTENLHAQRRNYYLLAQEAEELAAAGLFLRAADKYGGILGSIRLAEIRDEFAQREAELRSLAGVIDKTKRRITDSGREFGFVKLGNRSFRVTGLRGDTLLLEYRKRAVERPWQSLEPEEVLEILRTAKLESRDRLAIAVYCFDLNLRVAWYGEILAALETEELREDAGLLYSRKEGVPYPEGGFVSYRDRILTRAERAEEIHREQVTELRGRQAKLYEKLRSHPAFGKRFTKLLTMRAALDKAREHALVLIFDEVRYFYPKDKDLAAYQQVQKEVDLRVAAVREIWDNPLKLSVKEDSSLRSILEDIGEIREELVALGVDTTEADRAVAGLTVYIGRVLTIREFFRDEAELEFNAYNRRVLEWNESAETVATGPERRQVEITNEYRVMMGRRALFLDDILVKTARGHSDEMARLGYFDHFSPNPDRKDPTKRAKLEGYTGGNVSENIHRGSGTPDGAHHGWVHSSGHHRNLLQALWTQMGTGMVANHWTQNFGRTKPMKFPNEDGRK